jgi:hypothetical protein
VLVMGAAATTAVVPTVGSIPKKQPKARKMAKDMTLDERKIESKKRACRREATKNHRLASTRSGGKIPNGTSPCKPWPTARNW